MGGFLEPLNGYENDLPVSCPGKLVAGMCIGIDYKNSFGGVVVFTSENRKNVRYHTALDLWILDYNYAALR